MGWLENSENDLRQLTESRWKNETKEKNEPSVLRQPKILRGPWNKREGDVTFKGFNTIYKTNAVVMQFDTALWLQFMKSTTR